MSFADSLVRAVDRVRTETPLVHSITNYVVMNPTANALLAAGAAPVMAHARQEVAEMARLAGALVLNIGTLSGPWIEAMHAAAAAARAAEVPIILDPVGAGATTLRTETVAALLADGPVTVIRGNASEILAVAAAGGAARGVDSVHDAEAARDAAASLARTHETIVCVSGATDYVTDGEREVAIANGVPLMARITGMGCTASALVAAHVAVGEEPRTATACAMAVMGIAGELAAEQAAGPGSLQVGFLDALHGLGEADLRARVRVRA